MTKMIENQIKKIIGVVLENPEVCNCIHEQTNLIEELGFDSLQTINFILMLEDEFDIEIDFEEIEFDMFLKFDNLVAFLERKIKTS